jgi:hypothetical protein
MTTYETLQTGTATVSDDASFDDGPFLAHGVAQASEVTRGVSGQRRYWPPETLREAAEKLVGTPLVDPSEHDDLNATQPDPTTIIGEVTDAAYDEQRAALVYQAELDDPEFAKLAARGRIDVSPSVRLRDGDRDEERDATQVAEVLGYRDLAAVTEGAHASASINLGAAEALARHFEVDLLQTPAEANAVDVDVSLPDRIINAAEAAAENGDVIPDSCGTGVGDTRLEQIRNDDLQPADLVTRFNDLTPVPAYLTSHESDTTTDDPPTEWGEEEWSQCGNAQQAKWGWYTEWFQQKANEILAELDEPPAYEALQRDRARRPAYSGTQDAEWSTPTLDDYLNGYDSLPAPGDVSSVDELTREQRSLIARKSLLGTAAGETLREVRFFPVVDPETNELNRRALGAVRSGRGAAADIPDDARASAQRVAGKLLVEEFGSDIDIESMADVADVSEGTLVRWNSTGDRPAYGLVEDVRTEGDDPLTDEIDGDQRITPPAALIEVHRPTGDDGAWEPSGTMVGHTLNSETLTVIEELPDPESLANHRDGDDGHTAVGQSTPVLTDPTTTMSDLTDKEQELLAAARQKDDPTVVEAGVPERLNDHDELIDDAESAEDPMVVEASDYEALQSRVDTVEGVFAEALQDRTGLSDQAIEAMPFEAMAAEFETDDGDLNAEALTQSPETGSDVTDSSSEALSGEEKAEAEEHREVIESLAGKGGVAEHERKRRAERLAEITGEDPDTILEEA